MYVLCTPYVFVFLPKQGKSFHFSTPVLGEVDLRVSTAEIMQINEKKKLNPHSPMAPYVSLFFYVSVLL
jgi:hypothetical protein